MSSLWLQRLSRYSKTCSGWTNRWRHQPQVTLTSLWWWSISPWSHFCYVHLTLKPLSRQNRFDWLMQRPLWTAQTWSTSANHRSWWSMPLSLSQVIVEKVTLVFKLHWRNLLPFSPKLEVWNLKMKQALVTESYYQRHPMNGLITFTCLVEPQEDKTMIEINGRLNLVKVGIGRRLILNVIFNPLINGLWKTPSTQCVSGHQSPSRPESSLSLTVKIVTSSMRAINAVRQRALVVWSTLNALHLCWHSLRLIPKTVSSRDSLTNSSVSRQWYSQWRFITWSILSILNDFLRESESISTNRRVSSSWLDGVATRCERCLWFSFACNHCLHQLERHPIPPCDCWDFILSLHLREGRF